MPDQEMHQIGSVADAVGLSLRTLRHYEEVGLVVPSGRSAGGFRLYADGDVDRLRGIKRMKSLNFSLEEIRDVLELLDALATELDDSALDTLSAQLETYAALAAERCERLRHQLAAASEFTETLTRAAGRTRRGRSRSSMSADHHDQPKNRQKPAEALHIAPSRNGSVVR